MSETEKVIVKMGYGALAPSLEEQANEQGLTLGEKAKFLEDLRKARTMLMFHVLTESQTESITQKIHKLVMRELRPKAIARQHKLSVAEAVKGLWLDQIKE